MQKMKEESIKKKKSDYVLYILRLLPYIFVEDLDGEFSPFIMYVRNVYIVESEMLWASCYYDNRLYIDIIYI